MRDDEHNAPVPVGAFAIVGIGASAGGLEALHELLHGAKRNDPAAYVVIQHLDPTHDSVLAELLDRRTELAVRQAEDGMPLAPGCVYTIPPGMRLLVKDGRLRLCDFDQPRGLRRPVDDFLESLARDQGPSAACVILSGTGGDGTLGLRSIKEHGGLCVVQDPGTARYDGMPASAQSTGLVDFVLPPGEIIAQILRFFQHASLRPTEEDLAVDLRRICDVLHERTGHDFSGYKTSTLLRRVRRRMQVLGKGDSQAYLAHLRETPVEAQALLNEFLINVTQFFRDPEMFETLRRTAIKPLVAQAGSDEIRVWVPGCSSGEEAYSIAMLLDAELRAAGRRPNFMVFATDIDERMIELARIARYPLAALADIPEAIRHEHTSHSDGMIEISPQLRDRVRFSIHSVVRDAPFSRMDMISCRNLLIYLDGDLQSRVLPIFHFALRPGGYLFLGPSEGLRREGNRFTELDRTARIYRRDEGPARLPLQLAANPGRGPGPAPARPLPPMRRESADSASLAQRRLLERHVPPGLLVSKTGEVLWSAGRLGRYVTIDLAERGPLHVETIVNAGLQDAVAGVIAQVGATGRPVIVRDLQVRSEMGVQPVTLLAEPLPDGTILLIFHASGGLSALPDPDGYDDLDVMESSSERLARDLRQARLDLRATVDELETANEELKSSNEEMMSMNEELQSTNEELSTVNDELSSKIDDVTTANSDLQNFFSATKIPLLVVDRDAHIRSFTSAALEVFRLRDTDHGRPLGDVASVFGGTLTETMARKVIATGEPQSAERVEEGGSRAWRIDAKPYRGSDGHLDGAMLVFEDITTLRDLRQAVELQQQRLASVRRLARIAVWQFDPTRDEVVIDDSTGLLGLGRTATMPLAAFAALISPNDRQAFLADLEACADGEVMRRVVAPSAHDSDLRLEAAGQRLDEGKGLVLGVLLDVTGVENAARLREAVISEMDHRVKNLFTQISVMLRMAARETDDAHEVVEQVTGRINALAQSHSLTTRRGAQGDVDLRLLVQTTLAPYVNASSHIDGPPVPVPTGKVVPLSLIMHELATNAFKYGVLGEVPGRLDVEWSGDEAGTTLVWTERYETSRITTPPDEGFGSVLLEGAALQLDAQLEVEAGADQRVTTLRF